MLRRDVTRETSSLVWDAGKERAVVVSVQPLAGVVTFRLKGTRRSYSLPARYLYVRAVAQYAALDKANRVRERKARRRAAAS